MQWFPISMNFKTTKYYIEYSENVMIHVFQPDWKLYLEKGQYLPFLKVFSAVFKINAYSTS